MALAEEFIVKPKYRLTIDRFRVTGWAFALPGLLALAIVLGFPVIYSVVLAFSSYTLLHAEIFPFAGLDNFISVLSSDTFWHSAWLTIRYSLLTEKIIRLRKHLRAQNEVAKLRAEIDELNIEKKHLSQWLEVVYQK